MLSAGLSHADTPHAPDLQHRGWSWKARILASRIRPSDGVEAGAGAECHCRKPGPIHAQAWHGSTWAAGTELFNPADRTEYGVYRPIDT